MEVWATEFPGVVLCYAPRFCDERGSFERVWSADVMPPSMPRREIAQVSLASNSRAGTIRGLHFAIEPDSEAKYVRCLSGAIYDVVVDIQKDSKYYGQFLPFRLAENDGLTLCILPGYAHGYQTLIDNTQLMYLIDRPYVADSARTIRYNDPGIGIPWPLEVTCVADRDAEAPLLDTAT